MAARFAMRLCEEAPTLATIRVSAVDVFCGNSAFVRCPKSRKICVRTSWMVPNNNVKRPISFCLPEMEVLKTFMPSIKPPGGVDLS